MLGAMEDVSERKKVEDELYGSQQMMQLVLDHIPQRVFWKDRNYRYLGCNKPFLGDAGLSDISLILGKDDFELIWKDTAPLYRADDRFVMESDKVKLHYEEPQYRTDGSSSWLRTSKTPLHDQDGNVIGILGTYEDITEQKKMELALLESEIKYRELVDRSLVGIYITQNHIIKFCNKRFTDIFGFSSPEEIIGTHVRSIISAESWESVDTQVKLRESGKIDAAHYEFKGQRKDGTTIDVEALGIRIMFEGKPAVQGSLIDITDKKAFQTQMLRSQRLESLGTLAGGIAHDLNNVLSPILLSIEILKKHLKDDKSLQILETVNTSATRGREIIKQVLTFARGFTGEHVILQPKHILRELEHIINETFPKSITLENRTPKDLWTIEADPTQIQQVLLNVAINARDAMPYGGTLKITAENVNIDQNDLPAGTYAKPGHYVKVGIEDSGTGIPPEIVDKIFEPFFTTKERGKGTGLGLSTVHSIVKSHRGYITINTELGKGTLFTIYLPAAEERKSQTTEDLLRISEGKGEIILVVDDEQSILDITKNTLEMYGYRVITAHDGVEALSIYTREKDKIDVVIADIIMPSLDGIATASNLRKMNPNVKIITSSGIKISEIDSASLGTVNHIFLQKPYTAEKLLSTLQEILYPKKPDPAE
jgi:PAS domain S-box-containing protein